MCSPVRSARELQLGLPPELSQETRQQLNESRSGPRPEVRPAGGDRDERLRFWEIDPMLRCPVVGMCLTEAEQRALVRRSGKGRKNLSDYVLHEALVAAAGIRTPVSERADALLEGKYGDAAAVLDALPELALMDRWRAALEDGAAGPVLWAAATRAGLSEHARREVFGSAHMAMHAQAHDLSRLRHKLAAERAETRRLRQAVRELTSSRRRLERELVAAGARAAPATAEPRVAGEERAPAGVPLASPLETPPGASVASLGERASRKDARRKAAARELERRAAAAEQAVAGLTRENARLSRALERARSASLNVVDDAARTLREALDDGACDADCPRRDLCGKRVLIVGGIGRMEARFRTMVEEYGGVCEHHDGRVAGGRRRLEGSVRRADLVICLSACNSHAACAVVKDCGKKLGKPIHLLDSMSLNAVAQVLERSAAS